MTVPFISATRLSWAIPHRHGTEENRTEGMKKYRDVVLKRDNYTCQGCGYRAEKFQEIHHIDGDHANYKESNLETLCPLCHQLFHPDTATISGGGFMIWLPELTQKELNQILFPIFWALENEDSPIYSMARTFYSQLTNRRSDLESNFGRSDAAAYGQMLLKLNKEEYESRYKALAPIKMLANPKEFQLQIDYAGTQYTKKRKIEDWEEWYKKLPSVEEAVNNNSYEQLKYN